MNQHCPLCGGTGLVRHMGVGRWRMPGKVQDRHVTMVMLRDEGFSLKQIGSLISRIFNRPGGKPLDHSTVVHHLQKHEAGKCPCPR